MCILLTSTITKLAVALVWSLQLECTFHWARGFSEGIFVQWKPRKAPTEKRWPGSEADPTITKG